MIPVAGERQPARMTCNTQHAIRRTQLTTQHSTLTTTSRMRMNPAPTVTGRSHWWIAGIYLLFGALWIVLSDRALEALVSDAQTLGLLQTWKGWGYVLITALMLFGMIHADNIRRARLQAEADHHAQLLRAMIDNANGVAWVKDLDGRFLMVNRYLEDLLQRPAADLLGKTVYDLFPPDLAKLYSANDARVIAEQREIESEEPCPHAFLAPPAGVYPQGAGPSAPHTPASAQNDELRIFLSRKFPVRDADGQLRAIGAICLDISERKQAEARLNQAAVVFNSSRDGVIIADASTRIIAVNRAFTEITGYSESEVLGKQPALLHSGLQDTAFYQQMWASVRQLGGWSGELWNRRRNGESYPEWLSISAVRDEHGELTHYVCVFTDLTQMKRSQEEVERLAHFDPLTGLANRQLFRIRLRNALERARRHQNRLAVLILDLDQFKDINDSLGHVLGDQVLKEVAGRLQHSLRESDVLARLGGDEMAVVIEELDDAAMALSVAGKILAALSPPIHIDGHDLFVTASIGISVYPDNGSEADLLLRNADTALYRAKDQGRNRALCYEEALSQLATERLMLETGLRAALEHNELQLHYQPQFRLQDNSLFCVEALLRWSHPEQGWIPPSRFIPVAERSGLIEAIGDWVLQQALQQLRSWHDAGVPVPRVAVNLSTRQLHDGLLPRVQQLLAQYRLPPSVLELEITESLVMAEPDLAMRVLAGLADLGITLAIDDFGTGYSSLAYLQKLHVHRLKIDRSFIQHLPDDDNDAALCLAILGMAHRLGLMVVAEGVETPGQRQFLQDNGCDVGQGWLFARALTASQIAGVYGGASATST